MTTIIRFKGIAMDITYKDILSYLVYIIVLAIPIAFVFKETVFIEAEIAFIEAPKVFLFRILTALAFPFVVYGLFKDRITINKYSIGVALFFGWMAVATLQSRDISISFWGEFIGQDSYSLLANLHYLVLVLAVVLSFDTKEKLVGLFKVIAISGSIASVPIILQHYSGFPIDLIPQGVGRPSGTFGNPVFAGSLISLTSICTAYLALRHDKQYGLLLIPQLISLLITQSRAGLLSVVIFGVIVGVLSIKALVERPSILKVALITLAVIIFTSLTFLTGGVTRLLNSPQEITGRTTYWTKSVSIITDSPLFGVGPDMFRYFYLLKSPANEQGIPEEPDHAHNWIVHNTVETGVPGGLISGAILIGPVFFVNPILGAIFIGHGAEQMFGVGRISDLTIFFILLGVAYNAYTRDRCIGF